MHLALVYIVWKNPKMTLLSVGCFFFSLSHLLPLPSRRNTPAEP